MIQFFNNDLTPAGPRILPSLGDGTTTGTAYRLSETPDGNVGVFWRDRDADGGLTTKFALYDQNGVELVSETDLGFRNSLSGPVITYSDDGRFILRDQGEINIYGADGVALNPEPFALDINEDTELQKIALLEDGFVIVTSEQRQFLSLIHI